MLHTVKNVASVILTRLIWIVSVWTCNAASLVSGPSRWTLSPPPAGLRQTFNIHLHPLLLHFLPFLAFNQAARIETQKGGACFSDLSPVLIYGGGCGSRGNCGSEWPCCCMATGPFCWFTQTGACEVDWMEVSHVSIIVLRTPPMSPDLCHRSLTLALVRLAALLVFAFCAPESMLTSHPNLL